MVSMIASINHKNVDAFFESPIHIGDTMESVTEIMQIAAIKKYGSYDKDARYESYTFVSNDGPIVFEERCSGHREEYDTFTDKLVYLAEGHIITYLFRYEGYRLGISFAEDGTVGSIGVTYDPNGVLDQAGL